MFKPITLIASTSIASYALCRLGYLGDNKVITDKRTEGHKYVSRFNSDIIYTAKKPSFEIGIFYDTISFDSNAKYYTIRPIDYRLDYD